MSVGIIRSYQQKDIVEIERRVIQLKGEQEEELVIRSVENHQTMKEGGMTTNRYQSIMI